MKKVISVSRRTDVPAFYGEWFMNRVRTGEAGWVNPYGGRKCAVSLKPADAGLFVFWSKNFAPFMRHLDELDRMGFRFYFHFTITGHPEQFESRVPPWREAAETAQQLADRYSPDHVIWRFDPVIFSSATPPSHVESVFSHIAPAVSGAVKRCYISYVDYYGKVQKNFESMAARTGVVFHADTELEEKIKERSPRAGDTFSFDLTMEKRIEFAARLADIAKPHGITLYSCCENYLHEGAPGIQQGHCVDAGLIAKLTRGEVTGLVRRPTRSGCGCFESCDIGAYDTCPHGCIYCYANVNKKTAAQKHEATMRNPHSFALGRNAPRHEFPEIRREPPPEQPEIDFR